MQSILDTNTEKGFLFLHKVKAKKPRVADHYWYFCLLWNHALSIL